MKTAPFIERFDGVFVNVRPFIERFERSRYCIEPWVSSPSDACLSSSELLGKFIVARNEVALVVGIDDEHITCVIVFTPNSWLSDRDMLVDQFEYDADVALEANIIGHLQRTLL